MLWDVLQKYAVFPVLGCYLAGIVPLLAIRCAVPKIDRLPVRIVTWVEGVPIDFELV